MTGLGIEAVEGGHNPIGQFLEIDALEDNVMILANMSDDDRQRYVSRVSSMGERALDIVKLFAADVSYEDELVSVGTDKVPYCVGGQDSALVGFVHLKATGEAAYKEDDTLITFDVAGREVTTALSTVVVDIMVQRRTAAPAHGLFGFSFAAGTELARRSPSLSDLDEFPASNKDLNFVDHLIRKLDANYKKLKQS